MLPKHLDEKVARLHLDALGVQPDRAHARAGRLHRRARSRARTSPTTTATRPTASPTGLARIEWADGQMPVLRSIRERFASERPLAGVRVGACLHVTAETANLVAHARGGRGARSRCAPPTRSRRRTTSPRRWSATSRCTRAARRGRRRLRRARVAWSTARRRSRSTTAPTCWARCTPPAGPLPGMLGGTEETTTGLVRPARARGRGRLACPVIAVNEARTERAFNDRFGTGQSALDGILRATNLLLAGQTVVVLGYGWTGRGIALRARGAGAHGDRLRGRPDARAGGADGGLRGHAGAGGRRARRRVHHRHRHPATCCAREHFERMKDGAVLANAGHFDVEIALAALRRRPRRAPRGAAAGRAVRGRRPRG